MNGRAVRSACIRAGSELQITGQPARSYFRSFSTSQRLEADHGEGPPPPRPSVRQRGQQNAAEISSMARKNAGRGAGSAPARASRGRPREQASGRPKVIDVKSLPTGFSGRGGRGAQGVRTGRGGRGGGRGGMRRGRGKRVAEGDEAEPHRERAEKVALGMGPNELAFERALSHGERMPYTPRLDAESLRKFMPAVPSGIGGNTAAVVDNLRALGPADPVDRSLGLHAESYAAQLNASGLRFFADAEDKKLTQERLQMRWHERRPAHLESLAKGGGGEAPSSGPPVIADAEDSVRDAVLSGAVAGHHEKPQFAEDAAGVARSWHLRSGTFTRGDVDKFEAKLNSLLQGGRAGRAGAGQKEKTAK